MVSNSLSSLSAECTTREVAAALGLAVRSVQLMVDRGDLHAWKTPGGHRRISRASVEKWLISRQGEAHGDIGAAAADWSKLGRGATDAAPRVFPSDAVKGSKDAGRAPRVLLIEDSTHFQNLVKLLMAHDFPDVELHLADDGIVGLAMAGELKPDVLIVDILLPGIDGATLISRLRSHPLFQHSRLVVVTSLDEEQRAPYAFALAGVPVVHKPRLVQELPALVAAFLHPPTGKLQASS